MAKKENFYLRVYEYIKEHNKLPDLPLSKQALNYYLKRLKKDGLIERIGYGVWKAKEVKKLPKGHQAPLYNSKDIRGHAFILTFRLPRLNNWSEREKYLKKKNISYKRIGLGGTTQSISFRGHKVWLGSKTIVIYNPSHKSFFSSTATDALNKGLYDLLNIFKGLEVLLNTSFRISGKYKFKVSRQHYGKVRDALAKSFNSEGKKLRVSDNSGEWFIIDDSLNLNESETVHKKSAVSDMDAVIKPFLNDLKHHYEQSGETLTVSSLLELSQSILKTQQQTMIAQEFNQELLKKIIKRLEQ